MPARDVGRQFDIEAATAHAQHGKRASFLVRQQVTGGVINVYAFNNSTLIWDLVGSRVFDRIDQNGEGVFDAAVYASPARSVRLRIEFVPNRNVMSKLVLDLARLVLD